MKTDGRTDGRTDQGQTEMIFYSAVGASLPENQPDHSEFEFDLHRWDRPDKGYYFTCLTCAKKFDDKYEAQQHFKSFNSDNSDSSEEEND